MTPNEENLTDHFSGTCQYCGKYIDGRRHNVKWNPVKGLTHYECPEGK